MNKPIALDAYEAVAEAFAAAVDTKPHNAYYERPATLSLLPEVAGQRVLDAGCGAGVYSEWLIESGAEVFAIDASPKMIELTKRRLGRTHDVRQADLGQPLTFLDDSSFDIVLSPLVLDHIEDWRSTFAEFYRVLRPSGHFIFSVGHPLRDFTFFKSEHYFETESVGCEWKGFGSVYMPGFRRPLGELFNPLMESGFSVEKVLEPLPTEEFKLAYPLGHEKLQERPIFLCIRARK